RRRAASWARSRGSRRSRRPYIPRLLPRARRKPQTPAPPPPPPSRRRSRTSRSQPSGACPFNERTGRGIEFALPPRARQFLRDRLAELDSELVERIDPEQHGIGEGAVLIKGDERAERSRIEPIEEDRRARPVAGIGALRVVAALPLHQRRSLREGIEEEQPVMLRVLRII